LKQMPHASLSDGPVPMLALVAEPDHEASRHIRALLAGFGASALLLGPSAEAEVRSRAAQLDLLIVDVDFGGPGQGLRLAQLATSLSQASVVVIGSTIEGLGRTAGSERWHLLHRPVHERQLRATVSLALAQRTLRLSSVRTAQRQVQLEQAFREIDLVVRRYATANNAADRTVELGDLRPRERQIIDLLLAHRRVPAIAQALGISAHTVRNHLKNLYRRAGVHSQQELLLALKQDDN